MHVHQDLNNLPAFTKSVLTIGSFDGVHIGHQKIIKRIKALASEIQGESVIITFHPHPRQVIYPDDNSLQLLTSLDEKLALFEKFGVDHVVVVPFSIEFSQQHPEEYIEKFLYGKFKPSYIVIGYDHRFGLNRQGDLNFLKSYEEKFNFKTIEIEKQDLEDITVSSTKVRKAILNNEITLANDYLNYHYMISGKVVYGEQVGQKIGYKTANIDVDNEFKLLPIAGIYATKVFLEQEEFGGMLYIGNKPTMHNKFRQTIEVHIFDFDQDIYGSDIRVELVDYIRDDVKFNSIEELKSQLSKDEINSRKILNQNSYKRSYPDTAIAILNYNGEEILEKYLPSTLHSTDRPIDYIFIDNASIDESVDYVKEWQPEYKIIEFTENYGFAGGYNQALRQLDYKYIVLMNSDIRCTINWLDPILDLMEADETIAAVSPKIRSIEDPEKFEYAGAAGGLMDVLGYPFCRGRIFDHLEVDEGQYDRPAEVFWASGATMVVRKSVYDSLNGFDSDFFAHQEEIDLCWRMKRAGYKVMVAPGTHVFHLGGGTLAYESPNKTYLNFRNNLTTLIKNDESRFWFLKFIIRLFLDGLAAAQMLVSGKLKNAISVARAHWYIFPRFFRILKQRKKLKIHIDKIRIGTSNMSGIYPKSIVASFFIFGKKTFQNLNFNGKV